MNEKDKRPPEVNPPLTEEDRRPNDRPFYIDPNCPRCGTLLQYDDLVNGETDWNTFFFDEFQCLKCKKGAISDWLQSEVQDFKKVFDNVDLNQCKPYTKEMSDLAHYLTEGVDLEDSIN